MIYEVCVVVDDHASEAEVNSVLELVRNTAKAYEGEVLLEDVWGIKTLAQVTQTGARRGNFLYTIVKGNNKLVSEFNRLFGINDYILKNLTIKLGDDENAGEILKAYKTPFSKKYNGSVVDDIEDEDVEGDRKSFSKRRTCWFSAKRIRADWKDPKTFSWLVNEFGKISPARVSSISSKHQRIANDAIKRARQIGIASNMTGDFAH